MLCSTHWTSRTLPWFRLYNAFFLPSGQKGSGCRRGRCRSANDSRAENSREQTMHFAQRCPKWRDTTLAQNEVTNNKITISNLDGNKLPCTLSNLSRNLITDNNQNTRAIDGWHKVQVLIRAKLKCAETFLMCFKRQSKIECRLELAALPAGESAVARNLRAALRVSAETHVSARDPNSPFANLHLVRPYLYT